MQTTTKKKKERARKRESENVDGRSQVWLRKAARAIQITGELHLKKERIRPSPNKSALLSQYVINYKFALNFLSRQRYKASGLAGEERGEIIVPFLQQKS